MPIQPLRLSCSGEIPLSPGKASVQYISHWIYGGLIYKNFIMEVWPGRESRIADIGNHISPFYLLTHLHDCLGQVAVMGDNAIPVIQLEVPPKPAVKSIITDDTRRRRNNRCSGTGGDIDAVVVCKAP